MCAAQNGLWGWDLDRHVFSVSRGRKVDPPILEHAVLKFFLCPAIVLLMAFTLLHKIFFGLELYNVTDFSPCTYKKNMCMQLLGACKRNAEDQ